MDLEGAKVALLSGEKIFSWEYQALKDIATDAGLSMEEVESKIKVQNGSVVELKLAFTRVADLTRLANFSSLQKLRLGFTQVSDITPLANLSSLQELDLRSTQVSDLTPIANLSSLQWLGLLGTPALIASGHIIADLESRGVKVIRE